MKSKENKQEEQQKKDFNIIKALYFGNHLNDSERERAVKILYLLKIELERRLK